MKRTINQIDFAQAFKDYGRENQFTIKALDILFDFLEQIENDSNEQIELDVIAICCDYTENTIKEWAKENGIFGERTEQELTDILNDRTYIVGDYTNEQGEKVVIYQNY
jgi:hypothetical protein